MGARVQTCGGKDWRWVAGEGKGEEGRRQFSGRTLGFGKDPPECDPDEGVVASEVCSGP